MDQDHSLYSSCSSKFFAAQKLNTWLYYVCSSRGVFFQYLAKDQRVIRILDQCNTEKKKRNGGNISLPIRGIWIRLLMFKLCMKRPKFQKWTDPIDLFLHPNYEFDLKYQCKTSEYVYHSVIYATKSGRQKSTVFLFGWYLYMYSSH
jgi:hypothetical protein